MYGFVSQVYWKQDGLDFIFYSCIQQTPGERMWSAPRDGVRDFEHEDRTAVADGPTPPWRQHTCRANDGAEASADGAAARRGSSTWFGDCRTSSCTTSPFSDADSAWGELRIVAGARPAAVERTSDSCCANAMPTRPVPRPRTSTAHNAANGSCTFLAINNKLTTAYTVEANIHTLDCKTYWNFLKAALRRRRWWYIIIANELVSVKR